MAQRDLQTCIYGVGPQDLSAKVVGITSLNIRNFSLDVDQYTTASGKICVDLVDYDLKINTTSGTYFMADGTVVSGTFTPITVSGVTTSGSAYRMCYDPINDFDSLIGPTKFTAHVTNSVGTVLEKDYYLTYGYKVEFDNEDRKYIDFGYQKKVIVRAVAENLASCTKESGYAYWFETKTQPHNDLSCSIRGTYIDGLPASIYPQSTTYFYGKTYELKVTARDFAGNEMEPFILVYTIENKT